MSEGFQRETPRKTRGGQLADRIRRRGQEVADEVKQYESAGRFGRWLIRLKHPYAANRYDYLQAQESVAQARLNPE